MDTITRIYKIVREAYDPSLKVDKELTKKVEKLVQEHVNQSNIKDALDIYEINESTLKKLEEKKISDEEKVFNLAKSIARLIVTESNTAPFLISIGQLAEALMENYKERQKDTQQTLEELKVLIEEINQAKREQAEKGMLPEIFSIYWILKKENVAAAEEVAQKIGEALSVHPYWKTSEQQERELKQKSLKILLNHKVDIKKSTELVQNILNYFKSSRQ